MASVEERVKQIIVAELAVDEEKVRPEATFAGDLGGDSLDTIELVMAFEAEFDCDISDEDAANLSNVQEAIDYIKEHVRE